MRARVSTGAYGVGIARALREVGTKVEILVLSDSGLLSTCKAAGKLGEREQKEIEAAVARAVVSAHEVVIVMLHAYMR